MSKKRPYYRYPAHMSRQSVGNFKVNCTTDIGFKPIPNATVAIKKNSTDAETIETLETDISGQTSTIELPAPPVDYSLEAGSPKPYSEYTVEVNAPGYETVVVEGAQVLPDSGSVQPVELTQENTPNRQLQVITINQHTLYGTYPPKIPESEIKPPPPAGSGFIVLPKVVVPEIVVVHDGAPDDPNAKNYYIGFQNYIKNVASSEIYSTWPENSIISNILAILSFTLNRVYTEWYRAKGYNFTITSSTAYDHKFIYGRNLYDNISKIVDNIFTNYISRPGIKQPLFTQYCDGYQVQCPNWMT